MIIRYNKAGAERKALAGAISQELNTPVKYLGAPTFAYQLGGYQLDRNGVLEGDDNRSLIANLQEVHSFIPTSEEYDLTDEAEIYAEHELRRLNLESQNIPDYSNRGQYGGDGVLEDWENGMTEEEELGLGPKHLESLQGENGMQPDGAPESYTYRAELSDPNWPDRFELFSAGNDLEAYRFAMGFCEGEVILLELHELNENYDIVRWVDLHKLVADNDIYDTLEIEVSKNGMTDIQVKNLLKLVDSKRTLLAKAIGRPLVVKDSCESVLFEFPYDNDNEASNIYAQFATALIRFVIKQQKVTSVEKKVSSDKFTLRTFLVRLDMNGREYAAARKYLLRNLSGSSAYAKVEG